MENFYEYTNKGTPVNAMATPHQALSHKMDVFVLIIKVNSPLLPSRGLKTVRNIEAEPRDIRYIEARTSVRDIYNGL